VTERHFTLPARPSTRTRGGRLRVGPAVAALAAAAAFLAGCGSGGSGVSKDPVTQISTGGGLQAKVRAALLQIRAPAHAALLKRLYEIDGFDTAEDREYDPVRAAIELLGARPR